MLRLLTIIAISSSLLFCASIEKRLEEFFVASLSKYNISEFKINNIQSLEYPKGWSAYFVSLKYSIQDREIMLNDVVFSDNISVSRDFTNIESKKSLKNELLENNDKNLMKENR